MASKAVLLSGEEELGRANDSSFVTNIYRDHGDNGGGGGGGGAVGQGRQNATWYIVGMGVVSD